MTCHVDEYYPVKYYSPLDEHYYTVAYTVELTALKKKMSLSGESIVFTDLEGYDVFKTGEGHWASVRDKCTLLSGTERPKTVAVAWKKKAREDIWEGCRGEFFGDDNLFYTVKNRSKVQSTTHLEVFLTGNDNDDAPDFVAKGNFFEREVQIFQKGQLAAEIKRKFTVENVLLDKHIFSVMVYPHVDQAFIASLVIIMDCIHED